MAGKRKATSLHDQSSGSQHSAGNATASSSGGEHSAGNFSLMFVDEDNFDSRLLPHLVYDQRPPIDPQELEETVKEMNADIVVKVGTITRKTLLGT